MSDKKSSSRKSVVSTAQSNRAIDAAVVIPVDRDDDVHYGDGDDNDRGSCDAAEKKQSSSPVQRSSPSLSSEYNTSPTPIANPLPPCPPERAAPSSKLMTRVPEKARKTAVPVDDHDDHDRDRHHHVVAMMSSDSQPIDDGAPAQRVWFVQSGPHSNANGGARNRGDSATASSSSSSSRPSSLSRPRPHEDVSNAAHDLHLKERPNAKALQSYHDVDIDNADEISRVPTPIERRRSRTPSQRHQQQSASGAAAAADLPLPPSSMMSDMSTPRVAAGGAPACAPAPPRTVSRPRSGKQISNVVNIRNALSYVCLAGKHLDAAREEALKVLEQRCTPSAAAAATASVSSAPRSSKVSCLNVVR